MFDRLYYCQYTILIINNFNYLLLKIIKIVYFKSNRQDKLNISFINIYMYILVEKYGQVEYINSNFKSKSSHLFWDR
jgi:hypothetical protein